MSRPALAAAIFFLTLACVTAWRLYHRGSASAALLLTLTAAAFTAGAQLHRAITTRHAADRSLAPEAAPTSVTRGSIP
jgi:hypothetical protein